MKESVLFEAGKYFHVYHHAVGSENLFREHENYRYFLQRYADYVAPVVKTYAYCLMPNHFHLLVQVGEEPDLMTHLSILSEEGRQRPKVLDEQGGILVHDFVMLQFKHLLNGYTQAYNKRFQRKGSLFLRFLRRKEIEEMDYFFRLVFYLHHNPVRHGFCVNPGDWPHSSYRAILSEQPTQLARSDVLAWYGSREAFISSHQGEADDGVEIAF
ncbi:MAG: hypothetical protein D6722_20200 [Bacteroidetes bacterium]|nr:MAG: hypothetical protein D6722_20200 [Bacteroidota bacterium]